MKSIPLFRVGTHTSAGGNTLAFNEDAVRAIAIGYDPGKHEAPIVVGHPAENGPAYGWVRALSYADGDLDVTETAQVDEQFEEMVKAGRFKKVSASLYSPDSPSNPTPGQYYLRHVGFLGAQPPAIKGLKAIGFADDEEGVLEFSQPVRAGTLAMVFRNLREFLIDKFSRDEADRVLPDWVANELEAQASAPNEDAAVVPGFNEPEEDGETMTTAEKLAADAAALKVAQDKLAADQAEFNEQRAAAAVTAKAARLVASKTFVAGLVSAGQLPPAQSEPAVAFMEALGDAAPISFAEGEETPADVAFRGFLSALPKTVDFSERATAEGTQDGGAVNEVERIKSAAHEYIEKARTGGRTVTIEQAMAHVRRTDAAAA